MNINDLVGAQPELLQALLDLGLTQQQVDDLGLQVSAQLSEHTSLELRELLARLNAEAFLDRLDIPAIADDLECDIPTLQSALLRLASTVTLFDYP